MAINKRKVLEAARKYVQRGAQAKALKEFEKLLKLDPRDARLRLEIGDAYRRWGENAKAIETYAKVATQYTKEGFDARAVAVYKQIHNLDAEAYETYEPLAELYQRMGLTTEAIGALQTAADGFHKQNRKPEALELLRKMATLDPTNTASRIKVADLLKQERLLEEAVTEYEAASAELERQGDPDTAAAVYQRILEIDPDRFKILFQLARNLVDRGLGERAEPFAKRVLEQKPDDPEHYELMAAVYRLQNRDEELADTYRKLADVHRRRGDDEQAREILQRFVPSCEFDQDLGLDEETAFGAMGNEIPLVDNVGRDDGIDDTNGATLGGLGGSDFDELILETEAPSGADETNFIDDKDDEAALETDLHDDDLLLDLDSSSDPLVAEASEPAPPPPRPIADPDQLMAEASVYLRYGKREQAIANIEAIVAQNPEHRPAFEKLGEAYADGDQTEKAVENWLRAAEIARAAGDAAGLLVLRDRIGALDEDAAATIVPLEAEGRSAAPEGAEPEASSEFEVESAVIDMDSIDLSKAESDTSHQIDLDDIEIDLDDSDFDAALPDDEDGDSSDIGLPEGSESGPPDVAEPAAESSSVAGASASMVQQVREDLEEADFYMNQGLADEAEVIYQRVLSIAPNHPHALVRLGEVAAMRGEDPATTPVSSPSGESPTHDAASSHDAIEDGHSSSLGDDVVGPDSFEPDGSEPEADSPEYQAELTEPDGVAAFEDSSTSPEGISAETTDSLGTTLSDESLELASDGEALLPTPDDEDAFSPAFEAPAGAESGASLDDTAGEDFAIRDDAHDDAARSLDEPDSKAIASPDDSNTGSVPDLGEPPDLAVASDSGAGPADFDLAAELNDLFDDDGSSSGLGGLGDSGDGFEAVFSAFKKGVSETLNEGDHEAHFDLGIAYREMGLFDDARSEFIAASKNPESEFECRHMIGLCCFETGRYEEAIAEFEQIIAADAATDEQKLTARLESGRAWQQLGDLDRARHLFETVAAVDPSFCEVSRLLVELEASEKPEEGVANLVELESFDDLLLDEAAEVESAAGDPPTDEYESFDGFLEDETDYDADPELGMADDGEAEIVADPVSIPEPEPAADVAPEPRRKKRRRISFV